MKNNLKTIVILVLFTTTACKAQQVYPLITNPDNVPPGAHLKDTNDDLSKYVGIWKANVNGKTILLQAAKRTDVPQTWLQDKVYYRDILAINYEVKDSSGNVLESTLNAPLADAKIESMFYVPQVNTLRLNFEGVQCGVGNGFIFLNPVDANHFKFSYHPQGVTLTPQSCSEFQQASQAEIFLPYEPKNIIFTKQ